MSKGTPKEEKGYYQRIYGRTYTGSIMIFIGIVFLLINFDILPRDVLSKFWPIFIIIPGLLMVFNHRR